MQKILDTLALPPQYPAMPTTDITVADHGERAHSEISPSTFNLRDPEVGGCYGYLPDPDSDIHEITQEGIDCHEAQETGDIDSLLPHLQEHVRWSIKKMEPFIGKIEDAEQEVRLETGFPETWGWADFVKVWAEYVKGRGRVWHGVIADTKYGYWAQLPARVNRQGLLYAYGLLRREPQLTHVRVLFVYGRLRKYSTWLFKADRVRKVVEEFLPRVLTHAKSANPPLNPSFDVCRFCARDRDCPASRRLQESSLAILDTEGESVLAKLAKLPDPSEITTVEEMCLAKEAAPVLEKITERWSRRVRERAMEMVTQEGVYLPGWKLQRQGSGFLKIKQDREGDGEWLQDFLGFCQRYDVSPFDILETFEISLPKVADLAAAKAPRGTKGKVKQEVRELAVDEGFFQAKPENVFLKKENPSLLGTSAEKI